VSGDEGSAIACHPEGGSRPAPEGSATTCHPEGGSSPAPEGSAIACHPEGRSRPASERARAALIVTGSRPSQILSRIDLERTVECCGASAWDDVEIALASLLALPVRTCGVSPE